MEHDVGEDPQLELKPADKKESKSQSDTMGKEELKTPLNAWHPLNRDQALLDSGFSEGFFSSPGEETPQSSQFLSHNECKHAVFTTKPQVVPHKDTVFSPTTHRLSLVSSPRQHMRRKISSSRLGSAPVRRISLIPSFYNDSESDSAEETKEELEQQNGHEVDTDGTKSLPSQVHAALSAPSLLRLKSKESSSSSSLSSSTDELEISLQEMSLEEYSSSGSSSMFNVSPIRSRSHSLDLETGNHSKDLSVFQEKSSTMSISSASSELILGAESCSESTSGVPKDPTSPRSEFFTSLSLTRTHQRDSFGITSTPESKTCLDETLVFDDIVGCEGPSQMVEEDSSCAIDQADFRDYCLCESVQCSCSSIVRPIPQHYSLNTNNHAIQSDYHIPTILSDDSYMQTNSLQNIPTISKQSSTRPVYLKLSLPSSTTLTSPLEDYTSVTYLSSPTKKLLLPSPDLKSPNKRNKDECALGSDQELAFLRSPTKARRKQQPSPTKPCHSRKSRTPNKKQRERNSEHASATSGGSAGTRRKTVMRNIFSDHVSDFRSPLVKDNEKFDFEVSDSRKKQLFEFCLEEPIKTTTQLTLDKVVSHFSPQVHTRLIGAHTGVGSLDVLGELSVRGFMHCVQQVLSHLEDADLLSVSQVCRTWQCAVLTDPLAAHRLTWHRTCQLQEAILLGKENQHACSAKPQADHKHLQSSSKPEASSGDHVTLTRGHMTSSKGQLTRVQPQAAVPRQPSPPQPSKPTLNLLSSDKLRSCPHCQAQAKVMACQDRAVCVSLSCGYDFCTLCFATFHGARPCKPLCGHKSKNNLAGSRKSKKNLRRL